MYERAIDLRGKLGIIPAHGRNLTGRLSTYSANVSRRLGFSRHNHYGHETTATIYGTYGGSMARVTACLALHFI